MPISIADLVVGKRKLSVTFPDGTLNLTYDPNKITIKSEQETIDLRNDGRWIAALAVTLAEVILDWDVVDDKGKALPVTPASIEALGYPVILYLNRRISEDFYPDPLAGLTSLSS